MILAGQYKFWRCSALSLLLLFYQRPALACEQWIAKLQAAEGKVETQRSGALNWQPVSREQLFCPGDKIRTAKRSRATLALSNASLMSLDQNSALVFSATGTQNNSWLLNLLQGTGFFRNREPQRLNIHTRFINAVHRGTEFQVEADAEQTRISVFDGSIAAENAAGRIVINSNSVGIARQHGAPIVQALTVKLEDAVQWSLYYPPLIDYPRYQAGASPPELAAAMLAYRQGDGYQAVHLLDGLPQAHQNAAYFIVKSGLLLSFGRVDETEQLLDQLQRQVADNSDLYALRAIIAVAKNRPQQALNLALQAVELGPHATTAYIALSYAQQSLFHIRKAQQAAQQATQLSPDNALAWARLSELLLSLGERKDALAAARKAESLNPYLARTQTILGFAKLAQTQIGPAKSAFERALRLDCADPLPRLGLGLAKIRAGTLEAGKNELETAVMLDPNNAVARSYLGKVYYELRNNAYAETEFELAKNQDPNDPTPWFYQALLKQTSNRPLQALGDMRQALIRNGNRGVYRSQLLLDEDAAARSANLARIYNDLGFNRLALNEAWTALSYDATNYSAHRFLADSYAGQARFRVGRASEILQAQLLQPLNITPVQPQLTSENIGILNSMGPASLSLNEYDPLFAANGAHVWFSGAAGSNNTLTDNTILSGIYDRLSMSFGQFHFQSDGFRDNDAYQQDIYDAFAQYAVGPDLNIQAEFKSEDVRAGDVALRLNGFHRENWHKSLEQDTFRFGLHQVLNAEQDLLLSYFYTTLTDSENDGAPISTTISPAASVATTSTAFEHKANQIEIQHLYHPATFDLIAGLGYSNFGVHSVSENVTTQRVYPFLKDTRQASTAIADAVTEYLNGYVYLRKKTFRTLETTFGLGFDVYDDGILKRHQIKPKFGAIWRPTPALTLRMAAFKMLKRPLAATQTLEPTQIAGFNQFFDAENSTTAWNYGFGIDYQISEQLYTGGYLSFRDIKSPVVNNDAIAFQGRDEASHLAYVYWIPHEWWSAAAEYRFDEFRRGYNSAVRELIDPSSLTTHVAPLSLHFYHPQGWFSRLAATYVNQEAAFVGTGPELNRNSEDFWIFDAAVGYRFSKKLGSVSLEVRNLFDNAFNYQSTFDPNGPQQSIFIPERQLFFKLNLAY